MSRRGLVLMQVEVHQAARWTRTSTGVPMSTTVARTIIHPVRIHPTTAQPAPHHARQLIRTRRAIRGRPIDANSLRGDEISLTHERRMRTPFRDRPPTRRVRMPMIAVSDPVPHLTTGVPRIPQDLHHRTQ